MIDIKSLLNFIDLTDVVSVPLSSIAEYVRGVTYRKSDERADGDIAVLRANNITLRSNTLNFDDLKRVSKHVRVRTDQKLKMGDILMCAGSGSKDHIGKVAHIGKKMDYTFGGFMSVVRPGPAIDSRFLFHLLTSSKFSKYLERALSTSTINNLNARIVGSFKLPLPPLEIQRSISQVLDHFTKLEAELEAELEARQAQFIYYHSMLLESGKEFSQKVSLASVAKYSSSRVEANTLNSTSFVGVDNLLPNKGGRRDADHAPSTLRVTEFNEDDILIGNIRPYLRKIWLADRDGGSSGDVLVLKIKPDSKNKILPSFLYFVLSSENFFRYNIAHSKGAKMPRGDKTAIMRYKFWLPPVSRQKQIVSVLSRFQRLTTSLTDGIPAEKNVRYTQYEYYRDKLLDFKGTTS